MHDAAAGRHPLHIAGAQAAFVAEAVAVLDRTRKDVCDRFNPAMGMPREALQKILRTLVAEVVEQQKGIELFGVAEPKGALELHASAFEGVFGLQDAFEGSERHGYS